MRVVVRMHAVLGLGSTCRLLWFGQYLCQYMCMPTCIVVLQLIHDCVLTVIWTQGALRVEREALEEN